MAQSFAGKTLLIVDDEEYIRSTLGGALQDEGFQVRSAAEGVARWGTYPIAVAKP